LYKGVMAMKVPFQHESSGVVPGRGQVPTVETRDLASMVQSLHRTIEHHSVPYLPQRMSLYTIPELMAGYRLGEPSSFGGDSTDGRIYAHYHPTRGRPSAVESMLQRLHDHAIDEALQSLVQDGDAGPARVVAFMGGHALQRTDPMYTLIARCAQQLARRGYLVATGGGPGAMEAANLGAYASHVDDDRLLQAMATLAAAPGYRDAGYLDLGWQVRQSLADRPAGVGSLGIPTWFYGHEPTNLFCTSVAKYFHNALREEALCAIARHGIVFAPGGPGTLQEVFMDLCQNAYATYGDHSAMVLLGRTFWQQERPVFPLLEKLGRNTDWGGHIACVDAVDEVVQFIETHPPQLPKAKP
jgi:predicted Rossmann-fold nucleotide-binding protein